MKTTQSKHNTGFTLIELIMVIAILAIISTLAINKVGDLRKTSARKVSIANQQNIGRAVEAYIAINPGELNRLDALVDAGSALGGAAGYDFSADSNVGVVGGLYRGPDDITTETIREKNSGLHDGLLGVLCTYRINAKEADALKDFGIKYVMQHNTYANGYPFVNYGKGEDGTVPQAADGLDAALSACVTKAVTNGMLMAAVDGKVDLGRAVFQSCGQDLLPTANWGQGYNEDEVKAEISATGGPLLAFGLGDSASIIGAAQCGLDSAPYSEVLQSKYYRQYILLVRLRKSGAGSVSSVTAEFAGVLDPEGNTIRAARHMLK